MNSVFVLNETAATGIFTYRHTRSLHDALPSSTTTNPALSAAQQALYRNIPGFPFVNKINGDAKSHLTNVQFNSAYDFGDEIGRAHVCTPLNHAHLVCRLSLGINNLTYHIPTARANNV